MAGLALFGNMVDLLISNEPVKIHHRLESVKLIPQSATTGSDPHHHGLVTKQAVARPEIAAPERSRVFEMAVTAKDNRDRGRPTAWSAAVDSLAADADGQGDHPRLIIVSAGNTDGASWMHYPESNDTDSVHDPAQAWNALTVGAYTELDTISESDTDGLHPIAPKGGLSPYSTTSLTWDPHWPLKPDVVFEGGNVAKDSTRPWRIDSLSLLTSHFRPIDQLFSTINATSAAAALAAKFAARIMAAYPQLWPETIRALVVHSAEWTESMESTYLGSSRKKSDYVNLIRRCGFGIPDLDGALWSVSNSLSMVIQEGLIPFHRESGKQPAPREMHLHSLPWPRDVLHSLGETAVTMRVTLSYFVEPSPSRRGARSRYRYESHGLRFDVKRPTESIRQFRSRINAAGRPQDYKSTDSDDSNWLVGTQGRHKGSLHSDIWSGTAADLASRGFIGVYPALGWWKSRPALQQYDRAVRYALVVSIDAPEVDVDLYAAVAEQIAAPIEVETGT